MEKSIETIWKEGFLNKGDLIAPKLNALYNQKSQHIVDKMTNMFKVNLIAIMIGASVIFLGFILIGAPVTGGFIFILFTGLVLYSRKEKDKIKQLDKNTNSYQYLKEFDRWLNQMMSTYTKIYRFFYPTFFLAFTIGFWSSSVGKEMITDTANNNPDMLLIFGVPIYWLLGAFLVAGILSLFAGKIFRLDIKLVYGKVFKKLHEIIEDMEELVK